MTTIEIEFSDEAKAAMRDLTVALNGLAAATGAAGPDLEEPEPKTKRAAKKAAKKGPSVEEVRKALKDYAAIEGKTAAIEILNKTGGAASVGELAEDKYQAVIDKCNAGDDED